MYVSEGFQDEHFIHLDPTGDLCVPLIFLSGICPLEISPFPNNILILKFSYSVFWKPVIY